MIIKKETIDLFKYAATIIFSGFIVVGSSSYVVSKKLHDVDDNSKCRLVTLPKIQEAISSIEKDSLKTVVIMGKIDSSNKRMDIISSRLEETNKNLNEFLFIYSTNQRIGMTSQDVLLSKEYKMINGKKEL